MQQMECSEFCTNEEIVRKTPYSSGLAHDLCSIVYLHTCLTHQEMYKYKKDIIIMWCLSGMKLWTERICKSSHHILAFCSNISTLYRDKEILLQGLVMLSFATYSVQILRWVFNSYFTILVQLQLKDRLYIYIVLVVYRIVS